jgi:hypothetical protein
LNPQVLEAQVNRVRFVQKRLPYQSSIHNKPSSEKYEVYVEKEIAVGQLSIGIHATGLMRQDTEGPSNHSPLDSPFPLNDRHKYLLSASVLISIKNNVIQNSPMLIDQITKVFIPRIEILFPQDTYHIAKIISIITQHPQPTKRIRKRQTYPSEYFKIASLIREVAPLLTDLEKEHDYHGHGDPKKVCRHCVLKYRKATSVLQVIIGDYGNFDQLISSFELESIRIPGSQTGIGIKLPISIDSQEILLNIEIPFLMMVQEEGPFKDNLAVFTDKIESVNREKFSLKIKPYYLLANGDQLFSPTFTKTLWKRFIEFYKCLSRTTSSDENHLLNLFQEATMVSEIGEKTRSGIHLLFFRRSYNNKAMLGFLDGVQKTDIEALYKQCIISKFSSIQIESNDIAAFSSTFNIVSNIMLNSDLERLIEFLLRPIQATGLHKKRMREELAKAHDIDDVKMQGINPDSTLSDREAEDELDEKVQIEDEIGPVIEYKDVFTLRELFLQLMLDVSVNNLDLKINFDDKKSNVKIYISFICTNIRVNINTAKQIEYNMSSTTDLAGASHTDNYVSIENMKLDFGENALLVQQVSLDYQGPKNSFDLRLGYFTVDNRGGEGPARRLIQVGLDDVGMSKSLQYFAFQAVTTFDISDELQRRDC